MKIFTEFPEIDKDIKTVVTIGTFDGVHIGHSDLLRTVNTLSDNGKHKSVLVTFEPHPRTVVSEGYKIKILTTLEEKAEVLETYGIENIVVVNFTEKFSQLNAEEFIEKYLIQKLNPNHIVIGYDHKFGKDRKGDGAYLNSFSQKYNFTVTTVPAVKINSETVSSTKIRNALLAGDLENANFYLARPYSLAGVVVPGAQRGRDLGFPTANVKPVDENKLIPKDGVYIVECSLDGDKFNGVLNVGSRPTFGDSVETVIEVHLFELNRDLYQSRINVNFLSRIRDEIKFSSKEDLIKQIKKDIDEANEFLKTN
ncbi:MAG: bifunctional riboflavin kinase/FAD synthetase [Bacteroidetes bacterium]|nr:bifunctional riboflavin kinase/FAD synthetase [Bacteroidota bacterium]